MLEGIFSGTATLRYHSHRLFKFFIVLVLNRLESNSKVVVESSKTRGKWRHSVSWLLSHLETFCSPPPPRQKSDPISYSQLVKLLGRFDFQYRDGCQPAFPVRIEGFVPLTSKTLLRLSYEVLRGIYERVEVYRG